MRPKYWLAESVLGILKANYMPEEFLLSLKMGETAVAPTIIRGYEHVTDQVDLCCSVQ
jgi:hypothetical protein